MGLCNKNKKRIIAEFLIKMQSSGECLSLDNMAGNDPRAELLQLINKETVVPENNKVREIVEAGLKQGGSISPEDLPQTFL
jgi:hypothetical protein